jgi:methyl-accepting chemotaxis protein
MPTILFGRRLSARCRIWLLNLFCMVPVLLLSVVSGGHWVEAASLLFSFAILSSLLLPSVLPSRQPAIEMAPETSPPGYPDALFQVSQRLKELARSAERGARPEKNPGLGAASLELDRLNQGVTEISRVTGELTRKARESSAAIGAMAQSTAGIVDSANELVQVEQRMHSTLKVVVDNIGQAKGSIVELAETAIETSSRIFDMDESIARVDRDARDTVAISQQVLQDARLGKLAVESTLQGMLEIEQHSTSAAQVIGGLSQKAEDIGFILNVIKDVAEQTALLSLNAAIISAQAGDHGKGFAVVANEIKTLATRTRESVNEIAKVIDGVQRDTQLAVRAISTATTSIKAGETLALRSNGALEKIVSGVEGAARQMAGIAEVAGQQSASSQVIRSATEQLSRTICEISAVLCFLGDENEQILGATGQLAGLVGRLHTALKEQGLGALQAAGGIDQLVLRLGALGTDCATQTDIAARLSCAFDQLRAAEAAPERPGLEGISRLARDLERELAGYLS